MNVELIIHAAVYFAWFMVAFFGGRLYEMFKHGDEVASWARALEEAVDLVKSLDSTIKECEKRYGKL